MRKDAKIGFAIGGVLLAVLTVYVIVVPRHHNAISPNAVTLSIPADMPAGDTSNTPADTGGSAAKPADNAVAHNGSDGVNWERLLNGGGGDAPPLMTANSVTPSTPVAKDGGITVPGTTPASGVNVSSTPPVTIASSTTPAGPSTRPTTPTVAVESPAKTHSVAAAAAGKQYTIKAGQTLSSIAAEVYGNSRFYVAIIRANPNISPNHLKPGTQIVLPNASEVNPEASPATVTTVERTPAAGGRTYTVKSGDTLYAISKELFGTPKEAGTIYDLNKSIIGPNEARLKLGMVLKLPPEAAAGPTVSR
jgi:nucleoid-associated protein YgaU